MNLEEMRKDNLVDKFRGLLCNEYESQDQDILNIVCAGRIQSFPFRYNVMTKYCRWDLGRFMSWVNPLEIVEGKKRPVIIHYADRIKPWNSFNSPYSHIWLSVAMNDCCWDMFSDLKEHILFCEELYNNKISAENTIKHKLWKGVTFIPRKTYGGIKCFNEHGWSYTFNRVLIHLRIKEDSEK